MINGGPLTETFKLYNALRILCLGEVDFLELRMKRGGPPIIITESDPMPALGYGVNSYEITERNGYKTAELAGVLVAWK